MTCCECGSSTKESNIWKNSAKGYTIMYPICRKCYLETIFEPKWGKDFIMKYCPRWYEEDHEQSADTSGRTTSR